MKKNPLSIFYALALSLLLSASMPSLLLIIALPVFAPVYAQSSPNVNTRNCNGQTLSGQYADVIVRGGCTLDGAEVFGSVKVKNGDLSIENGTQVYGSVEVKDAGNASLDASTVFGEVKIENSGYLMVTGGTTVAGVTATLSGDVTIGGAGTDAGGISATESGSVTVQKGATAGEVIVSKSSDLTIDAGSVSAIFLVDSGNVAITNSRVFPGGLSMNLSGALTITNSEIGVNSDTMTDGSGGLNLVQNNGAVSADASSVIEGTVIIEKGTGDVSFIGTELQSDLTVIEVTGDVLVDGAAIGTNALVSDIKVAKSTGDITIRSVTADSDTTITENDGVVTIEMSAFGSDAEISKNKKTVFILGSSFALEDVRVSTNEGKVTIDGNSDLRPTIAENLAGVDFTNNSFTEADISKNGYVLISFNTGIAGAPAESLSCSDNAFVTGSGNNIEFVDGQCAGIPGFLIP